MKPVFIFALAIVVSASMHAKAGAPRLEELGGTRQVCATIENMPAICPMARNAASLICAPCRQNTGWEE